MKRVWIPKPGSAEKRPLGIPTVRDRMVQTSMRLVIEPIFEREFSEAQLRVPPRRGCKDALCASRRPLRAGYRWIVDADLKGYFDTIPHSRLSARLGETDQRQPRAETDRRLVKEGILDGAPGMDA